MAELTKTDASYKGKLLRLFREIMLLTKTPFGLSIKELEKKLGVTYRTIYRDLEVLQQVGFFPEEVSKGKYMIRGLDSDVHRFEKNLQFTAEEAGIMAQVIGAIPEGNPMKRQIMEKMLAFSGMEDVMKAIIKTDISRTMEKLSKAMREQRQVTLINYRSGNSQSIKNRRIEPFSFSIDGVFLKGFEHGQNVNKTYKIERIESVELLVEEWKFAGWHEQIKEADIFGITGGEAIEVKLRMSMRAANLLKEEYPLAGPSIYKEDYKNYLFEARIHSFIAVGRFILGLIDEIEILEPKALIDHIDEKISKRRASS